jgi:hypothetical protein
MPRALTTYSLATQSIAIVRNLTAKLAAKPDCAKQLGLCQPDLEDAAPQAPGIDPDTGLTHADIAYLATFTKLPLSGDPGASLSAPKLHRLTITQVLDHAARVNMTEQVVPYITSAVRANKLAQRRYDKAVERSKAGPPLPTRRYLNNSRVLDLLVTLGATQVAAALGEPESAISEGSVPNPAASAQVNGSRPTRQLAKSA